MRSGPLPRAPRPRSAAVRSKRPCEEQQTEADQFYKFFNVPKIERPRISPDHPEIQLMEEDAERIGYLDDDDEHDEANEANETSRALPSP